MARLQDYSFHCTNCRKPIKSLSGLTRHMYVCKSTKTRVQRNRSPQPTWIIHRDLLDVTRNERPLERVRERNMAEEIAPVQGDSAGFPQQDAYFELTFDDAETSSARHTSAGRAVPPNIQAHHACPDRSENILTEATIRALPCAPNARESVVALDAMVAPLDSDDEQEAVERNGQIEDESVEPINIEDLQLPDLSESNRSESRSATNYTVLVYQEVHEEGRPGATLLETNWSENYDDELPPRKHLVNSREPWWPFVDEFDMHIAYTFNHWRLGKKAIDTFLKDDIIRRGWPKGPGRINSWRTLMDKLYTIPYSIQGNDEWRKTNIPMPTQIDGELPGENVVIHRSVKMCLEFLLGHKPFEQDLVWAPVRKSFGEKGSRVYDELNTGDWWWDTQTKLPPGATVVPVMIASDKTLMTKLRGDRMAWPVYMTIGNLPKRVRRQQHQPATLLVGFLPISESFTQGTSIELAKEARAELYHKAMGIIFQPLKELAKKGWPVRCADGRVRQCHPILSNIMCDYEEVAMITGIKHNKQCGSCMVRFKEFEQLTKTHKCRSYRKTQGQLRKQETGKIEQKDPDWVHPRHCWVWDHAYVNVYKIISIDILHQLQKGVFRDMMVLTKKLIEDLLPGDRSTKSNPKKGRNYKHSAGIIKFDARFASIPIYPGLKRFKRVSHVTQLTGVEELALVCTILPAVAPLLENSTSGRDALFYIRSLVEFITIARYRSHDEDTLGYLDAILFRLDCSKEAFAKYRPQDASDGEGHFNTPKFHSMSHYPSFIRRYGSPDGVNTEHVEAPHKYLLKAFYDRTSKNDSWLEEIAAHNTRDTAQKAMRHHLYHHFGKTLDADKEITAEVSAMTNASISREDIGLERHAPSAWYFKQYGMASTSGMTVHDAASATRLKGFSAAVSNFIQVCRELREGRSRTTRRDEDDLDRNYEWVNEYPMELYASMACWRLSNKDDTNALAQERELLRCVPNWQKKGPRYDHCWVQEYPPPQPGETLSYNSQSSILKGRRVGKLQALIKVVDIGFQLDTSRGQQASEGYPIYYGAMVDLYGIVGKAVPDTDHGMITVTRPIVPTAAIPRSLKSRKIYQIDQVIRSAHVVPAGDPTVEKASDKFYINNYIDKEQYNELYDDEWEEKGRKRAEEIRAKYQR